VISLSQKENRGELSNAHKVLPELMYGRSIPILSMLMRPCQQTSTVVKTNTSIRGLGPHVPAPGVLVAIASSRPVGMDSLGESRKDNCFYEYAVCAISQGTAILFPQQCELHARARTVRLFALLVFYDLAPSGTPRVGLVLTKLHLCQNIFLQIYTRSDLRQNHLSVLQFENPSFPA